LYQLAQIREFARAVGVSKDNISPASVSHAVRHRAALATVLLQTDHSYRTGRRTAGNGLAGRRQPAAQDMSARELERHSDRFVP
jgi:hypothetical protein